MAVVGLHHVQIACPPGATGLLRSWYGGVLGMSELPTPAAIAARGGVWFAAGDRQLHCGVDAAFVAARKAHPCLLVDDVDAVARAVAEAGGAVRWSEEIAGVRRFHTDDPVGNRVELQQA
ncbi:glyoxalase [Nostocoides sp. Soil756]|jgi:predicted enzyme related to lactoylglutathione lyase|uniref:glyoxalase n=1 Tax=Nostocoides sp. Soil756 TaxID=1736399 RepID=UPI0006FCFA9C|nr:glyoxalase [Tetrasphaera sp. Soil756]KRE62001.1 glyoxalase [Tetrasphaera sp. Soil756]